MVDILAIISKAFRMLAWFMLPAVLFTVSLPTSQAIAQSLGGIPPPVVNVEASPIPMFAYYYIWFDPSSWDRAKVDYPILGKYSSDDPAVMRQHIEWAKQAGITGFIVSWKSTDTLNRRLKQLVQIADEEKFHLAIIYQGLDFSRNPLPADRIAGDLDTFIADFASDPAFRVFGKPLVIWSGTWQFSTADIAMVTQARRDKLLILASEKSLKGYNRVASLVDGDAYYWSSVNPDTFPGYDQKLIELSDAIHHDHGLWIAPAAAGFDARLIGGTTTVDRKNGDTLKREINAATVSNPDAIGLISWNEFSENSHIEPSTQNGMTYLDALSQINRTTSPQIAEFDSSEPVQVANPLLAGNKLAALGGFAVLVV
ncbi:MAG: endo-1,3-alpha-glucanase family glycosylhydrolase, partial [Anaerolineaceae bacterium]|nr:endo-1,3-alpha-glucanase family glycosylhydrolase [Anaerolineaceae bacterium]